MRPLLEWWLLLPEYPVSRSPPLKFSKIICQISYTTIEKISKFHIYINNKECFRLLHRVKLKCFYYISFIFRIDNIFLLNVGKQIGIRYKWQIPLHSFFVYLENENRYMVKKRRGLWHIYSWFLTNWQWRLTGKERERERERECYVSICVSSFTYGMVHRGCFPVFGYGVWCKWNCGSR